MLKQVTCDQCRHERPNEIKKKAKQSKVEQMDDVSVLIRLKGSTVQSNTIQPCSSLSRVSSSSILLLPHHR